MSSNPSVISKLFERIADLEAEIEHSNDLCIRDLAVAEERAEQAEAKAALLRDELASMTAQRDELHDLWLDAEQGKTDAEAEAAKWRWVATHEWVCPLDEMNPGEPGSYIVERNVHPEILARADEWGES